MKVSPPLVTVANSAMLSVYLCYFEARALLYMFINLPSCSINTIINPDSRQQAQCRHKTQHLPILLTFLIFIITGVNDWCIINLPFLYLFLMVVMLILWSNSVPRLSQELRRMLLMVYRSLWTAESKSTKFSYSTPTHCSENWIICFTQLLRCFWKITYNHCR